jgi:hypothetical protein
MARACPVVGLSPKMATALIVVTPLNQSNPGPGNVDTAGKYRILIRCRWL